MDEILHKRKCADGHNREYWGPRKKSVVMSATKIKIVKFRLSTSHFTAIRHNPETLIAVDSTADHLPQSAKPFE
ncbi:unnamed protein product [Enterobius vermicularis]|uniref:Uncharacterized protein n=1 Tax=Enterobius vermicularis TaxID=51028 RepID=A0A0N4V2K2_ENTVE|nr:unnamed protein product [Enterobius vermicularis]